jgi:hypothetical protein
VFDVAALLFSHVRVVGEDGGLKFFSVGEAIEQESLEL